MKCIIGYVMRCVMTGLKKEYLRREAAEGMERKTLFLNGKIVAELIKAGANISAICRDALERAHKQLEEGKKK
jgi:hypothetical protein